MQSLTKAASFPINLSVFRKHVCQMSRSSPWGMLKPSPRGWDKIVNVPLPGLTMSANTPRLPGGGWARIRYIMLEKFEYYAFERHPKKPRIMPQIMLEKYSIMLSWFLLYSTCFNNNCIIKRSLGLSKWETQLHKYQKAHALQLVSLTTC